MISSVNVTTKPSVCLLICSKDFTSRFTLMSELAFSLISTKVQLGKTLHLSVQSGYISSVEKSKAASDYLRENHILHCLILLKADNVSANILKGIADQFNRKVSEFFDEEPLNDDWIKDSISKLKQPIVVCGYGSNLYSTQDVSDKALLLVGFDKQEFIAAFDIKK